MKIIVLWIISHSLLAFCLIGLLRRSRFKMLLFFLVYVIFEEAQFAVLLAISLLALYRHTLAPTYQWVAIVGLGISSCLQLAVFYEIASTLILPNSRLRNILRNLLRAAAAVTILLAAGLSAEFSSFGLRPLTHIFTVLNFSTNLINLGLLFILFLFTKAFRVSWKNLHAGVMLGFAITSSAEIGATSALSAFGMKGVVSSDLIRMSAFIVCTLVWLIYIFLPETNAGFTGEQVGQSEIEIRTQELHGIVSGSPLAFWQQRAD